MKILALDLGVRMGVAIGPAGSPRASAVQLKKPDEHRSVAFGNLIAWLNTELTQNKPDLVIVEAPMSSAAMSKQGNSGARQRVGLGFHGIVEGLCHRHGIVPQEMYAATVSKHFIGHGGLQRADKKRATVTRCWLLGYLPRAVYDEDAADACAFHDYASATFARYVPKQLILTPTERLPKRRPHKVLSNR